MEGASDFSLLDPDLCAAAMSKPSTIESVPIRSERAAVREYALADLVDGIIEGLTLGAGEGFEEGLLLGIAEGDEEGLLLGEGEGLLLGIAEGEGEGIPLGAMEGASDFPLLAP